MSPRFSRLFPRFSLFNAFWKPADRRFTELQQVIRSCVRTLFFFFVKNLDTGRVQSLSITLLQWQETYKKNEKKRNHLHQYQLSTVFRENSIEKQKFQILFQIFIFRFKFILEFTFTWSSRDTLFKEYLCSKTECTPSTVLTSIKSSFSTVLETPSSVTKLKKNLQNQCQSINS